MTAAALLQKNPKPSRDQIVAAMDGNICRCGTYSHIIKAVQRASRSMEKQAAAPTKRAEATPATTTR